MVEIGDADLAHTTPVASHANAELAVRNTSGARGMPCRRWWWGPCPALRASRAFSEHGAFNGFRRRGPHGCCAGAWQSDPARGQADVTCVRELGIANAFSPAH